ncbi:Uncharacterized protein Nst1_011 [Candidatus Nanobsidianus stetteri]|uniref:Uncharacterized protein n=1 Tax=Nanobsidianus stetteri TaxID=1294122 RepID=R1E4S8_NANST|nr:Uncharacterized protein Nst1_011 [Candidatus Nanobsidianus stetteri]
MIMIKINKVNMIIFGVIILLGILTYVLTHSKTLSIIPFIIGIFYLLESNESK